MNSRVSPSNGCSRPVAPPIRGCAPRSCRRRRRVRRALCVSGDRRARLGAHRDALGMHAMLRQDHRRARVETCRRRRAASRTPSRTPMLAATREHRVIEVQSRRRRSDRAGLARVDRLIASRVVRLGVALDVRRQRHRAVPLEIRQRLGAQLQLEQIVAAADVARFARRPAARSARRRAAACSHARARGCAARRARARAGSRPVRRSASRR